MLKSGKLKLADDMIVTAQEAANKAETVFTIYDDTTNTQIASGPIGGGGGDGFIHLNFVNNVNSNQIYYAFNIGGGSIVNMPQTETAVIAIQNGSLMVSAEENPSMNYKFVFDDPSRKSFVAVYNSESSMYTATIETQIAYQSDTITVTFEKEPK